MAIAATPLVPKDGTITITDGAGTPLEFEVTYEDGDFQIAGLAAGDWEVETFYDRGIPYTVRNVKRKTYEFTFTCHAIALSNNSSGVVLDVVRKAGTWGSATSVNTTGDAHLVKVVFKGERTDLSATSDTFLNMFECHLQADFAEGIPGKLTIKGTVINITSTTATG